tara:strand:- start:2290 stop:2976 length:687 start_codon:yes stop_codon:yes gene_type:complete
MAQVIQLKRSSTAGRVPSVSDLSLGEIAVNTYDGKLYTKKNEAGSPSIVEIGAGSTAILDTFVFTASNSQTTFSGADNNGSTLTYNTSNVEIFLNGVLLLNGTDVIANTGNSVSLSTGANTGDTLTVLAFSAAVGSGDTIVNTFSGSGSTTAFTLSASAGREENTRVFVDGVYQAKSSYSISSTTLTFASAPANGTAIEVEIGSRTVNTADVTNILPSRAEILFMSSF